MKTAFALALATITLTTSAAFAEKFFADNNMPIPAVEPVPACKPTSLIVANMLIHGTKELNELNAQAMQFSTGVKCENLNEHVVKYTFTYRNCGLCFPQQIADLEIVQTIDPQLADAPPSYTSTLKYLPAEH